MVSDDAFEQNKKNNMLGEALADLLGDILKNLQE
jgi:hypothetical protein